MCRKLFYETLATTMRNSENFVLCVAVVPVRHYQKCHKL